jgi:hypothetical protein
MEDTQTVSTTCATCGNRFEAKVNINENGKTYHTPTCSSQCGKHYARKALAEALSEFDSYDEWLQDVTAKAAEGSVEISETYCASCSKKFVYMLDSKFNGRIMSNNTCSRTCFNRHKSRRNKRNKEAQPGVTTTQEPVTPVTKVEVEPKSPVTFADLALLAEAQKKALGSNYRKEFRFEAPKAPKAKVGSVDRKKKQRHTKPKRSSGLNRKHADFNVKTYRNAVLVKPKGVVRCPEPTKQVFHNRTLALEFIATRHPNDSVIHPYTCACGKIHIGH